MNPVAGKSPWSRLRRIAFWGFAAISVKVFVVLLADYRWYFPPDFENSPFLAGRRFSFDGLQRVAFYTHLVAGPLSLVLGTFLLLSGRSGRWPSAHRVAGRIQTVFVLALLVPTGLWMATHAYGGAIAAAGFSVLSVATGTTLAVAILRARQGQPQSHRRWATRCYLLLWSPLLLRFVSGILITTGLESDFFYRLNAWASWLVPLLLFEFWQHSRKPSNSSTPFHFSTEHRICDTVK